jgi:hypothetical protein
MMLIHSLTFVKSLIYCLAFLLTMDLFCNLKTRQVDDILVYMGKARLFFITKGMLEVYVGLHITRDYTRHCTQLDQTRCILKTL